MKCGDGSKPIDTFLVGWTSINPSYDLGFTRYQGFDLSPCIQMSHLVLQHRQEFTYWCVLRREFSGMIQSSLVMSSSQQPPATPSNPQQPPANPHSPIHHRSQVEFWIAQGGCSTAGVWIDDRCRTDVWGAWPHIWKLPPMSSSWHDLPCNRSWMICLVPWDVQIHRRLLRSSMSVQTWCWTLLTAAGFSLRAMPLSLLRWLHLPYRDCWKL